MPMTDDEILHSLRTKSRDDHLRELSERGVSVEQCRRAQRRYTARVAGWCVVILLATWLMGEWVVWWAKGGR